MAHNVKRHRLLGGIRIGSLPLGVWLVNTDPALLNLVIAILALFVGILTGHLYTRIVLHDKEDALLDEIEYQIAANEQAELHIQMQIAEYLTIRYPGVIFRSDLGGIRLNMGQAMEVKRLQGGKRAFPDMFIATPRHGYHGLFGEIKTSENEVFTKAGRLRQDTHTQEQWRVLERLCAEGYLACFFLGFDHAKQIVDEYLQ